MPLITLTDDQIEGLNQLCKVMHHLQPWMKPNDSATGLGDYLNNIGTILNNWNIGTDTLYGDYLTSGTAIETTGPNPPTLKVFRDNLNLFTFIGTGIQENQAFFTVHLLHDLKAGSTPTFHVHWSHIVGAPSGDVKWNIEYTVAKGYSIDQYPASVIVSSTQTAGAQYTHHITNDDDMPINDPTMVDALEPDAVLICRIFRDPSDPADTFANDAYLTQIDLHYEKAQIGTTERNRPFTSGGFGA